MTALSTQPTTAIPSGGMTRDMVVDLGRTGSAWSFIPVALAAVAQHPHDAEVRFLLAAAYAKLLLKTPALEQLALLGPSMQADPSVQAIAELAGRLPDDRVPSAELVGNLTKNLDALARNPARPVDLRPRLNAWKLLNTGIEWFRTRSGSLVRRRKGDAAGWLQFSDQAAMAREFELPHLAPGVPGGQSSPAASDVAPPYVIEGADPPWLFQRIVEALPAPTAGHKSLITLLQVDESELLSGLAQADLAALLIDPRVRVYAGAAAISTWVDELRARAGDGVAIGAQSLSVPTLRSKISPTPEQLVSAALSDQLVLHHALAERVGAWGGAVDLAVLAKRFSEKSLRILIPTYRHSTFIKHSAADLVDALNAMGHDARLMMEPDDHSSLTNLAYLKVIDEFRPDLVLQINYTRSNLQNVCPPGVVFATWIQDAMGHLFDKRVGQAQGRTDFILGSTKDELFQFFGYPRSRAMLQPMVASETKFHAGPVTADQRDRLTSDIAYVSHHGQTPEALHAERLAMARSSPGLAGALEALFPELKRFMADGRVMHRRMSFLARVLTARALQDVGIEPTDHHVAQVFNGYTMQMLDRLLRHQTLEWVADIARARNWKLKLFGKGWSAHPTLAEFAQGELQHGDDLRASYHLARVHLQVSAHTAIHQRVAECALSGGLALCRLQGDDLGTMEFQAGAEAVIAGHDPIASDPWIELELGNRFLAYRADVHQDTAAFADFMHGTGLARPDHLWMNSVFVRSLRETGTYNGRAVPAKTLLGDPSATMFATREALEARLGLAISDERWRNDAQEKVLASARTHLTYDALCRRLLGFIQASLASPDESDGRQWYDGRDRSTGDASCRWAQPTPSPSR